MRNKDKNQDQQFYITRALTCRWYRAKELKNEDYDIKFEIFSSFLGIQFFFLYNILGMRESRLELNVLYHWKKVEFLRRHVEDCVIPQTIQRNINTTHYN